MESGKSAPVSKDVLALREAVQENSDLKDELCKLQGELCSPTFFFFSFLFFSFLLLVFCL
jgi:hypothetical protein